MKGTDDGSNTTRYRGGSRWAGIVVIKRSDGHPLLRGGLYIHPLSFMAGQETAWLMHGAVPRADINQAAAC